jgi:Na+/proline symporter
MVYLYVFVILSACYSTIDGSLSAISSIAAVDVVKPLAPSISEKSLFSLTQLSMVIASIIATIVVLSGADFVTIVLTTYAIRTAILIPLMLAIFWSKMTASGFAWGTVAAIAIGMPIRMVYGELIGTIAILLISAMIPLILGLMNTKSFDYTTLMQVEDLTASETEIVKTEQTI